MTFHFEDAVRKEVPLLIGLCGGPGAGKTLSALKLAKGIQSVRPGPIALIDTEGGRAQKYVDVVPFKTIVMRPPFNPARFAEAINAALAINPACIIVDSMSDEHEGQGGVLDMHEAQLDKMAGNDWAKRDRVTQAAWIKPKQERKTFVNGMNQITTPLIFCFRAREKTKQIKDDRGKNVPTNIGWQPIAPSEIVHLMDVMAVLPLKSDGVPLWKSEKVGEDFVIKHPLQFRGVLTEGAPLSEAMGAALATWALGGKTASSPPGPTASRPASSDQAPQDGAGQDIDSDIARLFHEHVAARIRDAVDHVDLISWWNSDAQKTQRARLLTDQENAAYKAQVLARKTELQGAAHV